MSDSNTSPVTDTNELAANVSATGTSSSTASRPGYEIDPAHRHHADAILAMDPLQVPMPYDIPDGWAASLTLKATALPPAMQHEIASKLAALGTLSPDAAKAKEAEFTAAAIQSQRSRLITRIGVGRNATPYHREMASIARDVQDLSRQYDNLQSDLEDVARYEMGTDPVTGEPKAVPVYSVMGDRARGHVMQQEELSRRIRLLVQDDGSPGIEGARRAKQALSESVAARVELARQVTEEAEAKAEAVEINRKLRINARAESLARLQRNGA